MKKYLLRAAKYFVALTVVYLLFMVVMQSTGTMPLSLGDTFSVLFHTSRGWIMIGAMVVLSLFYPLFGFVNRSVRLDMNSSREKVINAFAAGGFRLVDEQPGRMTFAAGGLWQRISLLFEDEITVEDDGSGWVTVRGIRRGVARVEYRLKY